MKNKTTWKAIKFLQLRDDAKKCRFFFIIDRDLLWPLFGKETLITTTASFLAEMILVF